LRGCEAWRDGWRDERWDGLRWDRKMLGDGGERREGEEGRRGGGEEKKPRASGDYHGQEWVVGFLFLFPSLSLSLGRKGRWSPVWCCLLYS
jgi:hypothetical protein